MVISLMSQTRKLRVMKSGTLLPLQSEQVAERVAHCRPGAHRLEPCSLPTPQFYPIGRHSNGSKHFRSTGVNTEAQSGEVTS